MADSISTCLGVVNNIGTGKYLGLPSMVGGSKKAIFIHSKDRVWRKCQSWSAKSLSRAGKEVLINEIEKIKNSFYWGSKKNGNR